VRCWDRSASGDMTVLVDKVTLTVCIHMDLCEPGY